jgi:hypothetical protein
MSARGWKKYRIGELCQVTSSKRIFAQEYVDAGIPFYRSKEIIEKALGEDVTESFFIGVDRFREIKCLIRRNCWRISGQENRKGIKGDRSLRSDDKAYLQLTILIG